MVTEYTDEIKIEIEEKGAAKVFSLSGLRFYECPLSLITAESWDIVRLVYLVSESGCLLNNGGWAGQPAWLVEALEIYRTETTRSLGSRDG